MVTMPDGRPLPDLHADERAMLESWLDFHRATLARKCEGLTDEQLREASVPPSSMTLLGLVQHMTVVERNWFRTVFAGDRPGVPEETPSDGFALHPDRGVDEVAALWRGEIDRARELTAGASLDDCGALSDQDAEFFGERDVSLRWILVHMIEEYARHNGHADLLRERIDGVTGA